MMTPEKVKQLHLEIQNLMDKYITGDTILARCENDAIICTVFRQFSDPGLNMVFNLVSAMGADSSEFSDKVLKRVVEGYTLWEAELEPKLKTTAESRS